MREHGVGRSLVVLAVAVAAAALAGCSALGVGDDDAGPVWTEESAKVVPGETDCDVAADLAGLGAWPPEGEMDEALPLWSDVQKVYVEYGHGLGIYDRLAAAAPELDEAAHTLQEDRAATVSRAKRSKDYVRFLDGDILQEDEPEVVAASDAVVEHVRSACGDGMAGLLQP